jgi:ATP-dependent helicase HrpB
MVLKAQELGLGALACDLAAILSERDILKDSQDSKEADLRERVEIVRTLEQGTRMLPPGMIVDTAGCLRIIRTASRWKRQLGIGHGGSREDVQKTGPLLGLAYPDRMARRRPGIGNRYLLSNGRGAFFSEGDPLVVYETIAAAHLDGGDREARIFLAAPLLPEDLEAYFSESMEWVEFISWGRREQAVVSRKQLRLGRLVLKDEPLHHPDPSRVADALIEGIRQLGLNALPWTKELRNRQARILFLRRLGMKDWPDVSDEALLENLEEFLGPYLIGMTGSRDLQRLDLKGAFRTLLGYDHQRSLEELAPTHVTVPSGSRIPIRYSAGENPVLAVRLQEMFGALETPSVAGGKVRLTIHLLSPAGRPVQVTDDLSSFWSGAYYDVKKDLKGRYPRHHWPENPLEALPTKKVKPRVP